ncbi:MAG: hypothetical protein JO102_00155, partial [Elusimicrobia bacterium]|nr:hypothetical protein [Elusimicrobiota bacterium]
MQTDRAGAIFLSNAAAVARADGIRPPAPPEGGHAIPADSGGSSFTFDHLGNIVSATHTVDLPGGAHGQVQINFTITPDGPVFRNMQGDRATIAYLRGDTAVTDADALRPLTPGGNGIPSSSRAIAFTVGADGQISSATHLVDMDGRTGSVTLNFGNSSNTTDGVARRIVTGGSADRATALYILGSAAVAIADRPAGSPLPSGTAAISVNFNGNGEVTGSIIAVPLGGGQVGRANVNIQNGRYENAVMDRATAAVVARSGALTPFSGYGEQFTIDASGNVRAVQGTVSIGNGLFGNFTNTWDARGNYTGGSSNDRQVMIQWIGLPAVQRAEAQVGPGGVSGQGISYSIDGNNHITAIGRDIDIGGGRRGTVVTTFNNHGQISGGSADRATAAFLLGAGRVTAAEGLQANGGNLPANRQATSISWNRDNEVSSVTYSFDVGGGRQETLRLNVKYTTGADGTRTASVDSTTGNRAAMVFLRGETAVRADETAARSGIQGIPDTAQATTMTIRADGTRSLSLAIGDRQALDVTLAASGSGGSAIRSAILRDTVTGDGVRANFANGNRPTLAGLQSALSQAMSVPYGNGTMARFNGVIERNSSAISGVALVRGNMTINADRAADGTFSYGATNNITGTQIGLAGHQTEALAAQLLDHFSGARNATELRDLMRQPTGRGVVAGIVHLFNSPLRVSIVDENGDRITMNRGNTNTYMINDNQLASFSATGPGGQARTANAQGHYIVATQVVETSGMPPGATRMTRWSQVGVLGTRERMELSQFGLFSGRIEFADGTSAQALVRTDGTFAGYRDSSGVYRDMSGNRLNGQVAERTMDGYFERTQITGFQNGQAVYRGTVRAGQSESAAAASLDSAYRNGSESGFRDLVANGTLSEVTMYNRTLYGERVDVRIGLSGEHGVQTTYRMNQSTFDGHANELTQRIRDEKGKFRVETGSFGQDGAFHLSMSYDFQSGFWRNKLVITAYDGNGNSARAVVDYTTAQNANRFSSWTGRTYAGRTDVEGYLRSAVANPEAAARAMGTEEGIWYDGANGSVSITGTV